MPTHKSALHPYAKPLLGMLAPTRGQQLPTKDKAELIHLLEQEQYANNIPEEHKKIVRSRIKKYNKTPGLLIDEQQALKMINTM